LIKDNETVLSLECGVEVDDRAGWSETAAEEAEADMMTMVIQVWGENNYGNYGADKRTRSEERKVTLEGSWYRPCREGDDNITRTNGGGAAENFSNPRTRDNEGDIGNGDNAGKPLECYISRSSSR
jgi:hypothetical protein